MTPELLDHLRCPCCTDSPLEHAGTELACLSCKEVYPIEQGIPRLIPPDQLQAARDRHHDDEATRLKAGEMRARDEQAEAYDKMWALNLFSHVEIPLTLRYLQPRSSAILLEAGCGTGRMTLHFSKRVKQLWSVDFSWESLLRCQRKLRSAGVSNVLLAQADITRLPFAEGLFDQVVSCQVLEHVPAADHVSAVKSLNRVLKPDGHLAISAYQHNTATRIKKDKSGFHEGGIPYHRFERRELHRLLSQCFSVERMTGVLAYHYLARCRKEASHV